MKMKAVLCVVEKTPEYCTLEEFLSLVETSILFAHKIDFINEESVRLNLYALIGSQQFLLETFEGTYQECIIAKDQYIFDLYIERTSAFTGEQLHPILKVKLFLNTEDFMNYCIDNDIMELGRDLIEKNSDTYDFDLR